MLILSTFFFFFRRNTSDFQAVSIVSAMSQLLDPRWPGVHASMLQLSILEVGLGGKGILILFTW